MKENNTSIYFKVKDLKFYCNAESLIHNSRKYRSVFEQIEITYLFSDFKFYNIKFNEQDWKASIKSVCYRLDNKGNKAEKFFENKNKEIVVLKTENIKTHIESWGSQTPGSIWKEGKYSWEILINNKTVAEKSFTINNFGPVSNNINPYFFFESLQFYKASLENKESGNYEYLYQINPAEIEYLGIELKVLSKLDVAFDYEFYIVINNRKGVPKAFFNYVGHIEAGSKFKSFTIRNTWGSAIKGTAYKKGTYRVSILFMEKLFAKRNIVFGDIEIPESQRSLFDQSLRENTSTNSPSSPLTLSTPEEKKETLEAQLKELNRLIGLNKVKNTINEIIKYIDYNKVRVQHGFKDDSVSGLHAVFSGNPGTGKTTVVKLLGGIYKSLGMLSKGHVLEVSRADLVANFIGQTAPKTKEAIEKARGGILFIDEAYSLARRADDKQDFGNEVIEILLKEMSDGPGDIAIMVAGYPEEMQTFLASNPGLSSRFNNHFLFDDFLPEELMEIAELACKEEEVNLDEEAKEELNKYLTNSYRERDKTFGNARMVFNIIDRAKRNKAMRLMEESDIFQLDKEEISLIKKEDILALVSNEQKEKLNLTIDYEKLNLALKDLDELVGLDELKKEINELILLTKYYIEQGINITGKFSLHFSLSGNPGTGKTTIARLLGTLFNALGILERGHVIEVDRGDLVAGYVGQTAIKTKKVIETAKGGVLFIDEAYALTSKSGNDFGNEAIETILKEMEDNRNTFSVIVAGYPNEMDAFLKSNPGLLSRFNNHFTLPDFKENELEEILNIFLGNDNFILTKEAEEYIQSVLNDSTNQADKFFGNARFVRQLSDQIIRNAHLRLARLSPEERLKINTNEILLEDVQQLKSYNSSKQRTTLGFNKN
jgi:SpoVK/Ycf46/Vps4 family AAA+-type ATPase